MVGHYLKSIQFKIGKPFRQFYPFNICNHSKIVPYHLGIRSIIIKGRVKPAPTDDLKIFVGLIAVDCDYVVKAQ